MVRVVFIHIPKTAGSSFRDALCHGFGEHAVSPPFAASHLTDEDAERLNQYEVVCGHISLKDIERAFPTARLLTILREPIDRCVSWYGFAHALEAMPHGDVSAARNLAIDDFFACNKETIFRNIFNRHTRQLGDHVLNEHVAIDRAFARAQDTLARCEWVGRHETLPYDMERLRAIFPEMAGIPLRRLNVTERRPSIAQVGPKLRQLIMRFNEYDSRLYAHRSRGR